MRVSTANAYDNTVSLLTRRQAELSKLQENLATGKRVMRPSDDPVAATLAESAANRLSRTQADLRALEASTTSLKQAESGLAESSELIIKVRDLLVSAGNATFTSSEREDVAKQLEGLREQLIAVANRKDSAGRTLYGGLGGAGTPFVDLYGPGGSGVQFQGQRGQAAAGAASLPQALDGEAIWMRVPQGNGSFTVGLNAANTGAMTTDMGQVADASLVTGDSYRIDIADVAGVLQYTVTNTTTGTAVPGHTGVPYEAGRTISFDGLSLQMRGTPAAGDRIDVAPASTSTDIFQVVQNAVNALRSGTAGNSAALTQDLARAMTELDAGHDRVLLARGRAGEWLNRADSLGGLMEDRKVDLKAEKARLEDMDMVQGLSDFKAQELGLEAAIKSYAQMQRLSLFSAIG